jgi:4-nitrophenyl phosphatase/phosphoglycolate phosphatase
VRTRGLQTLAVLSGVTSEEKLLSPANTVRPDFYSDTIADMFPDL